MKGKSAVSQTAKKKNKQTEKKSVGREILSWVLTLAAAVAIALLIRTFLFIPVRVDGHSMQNTLMDKEVVLATKPEYLRGNFQRRDIVICHYPNRGNTLFVKRLVALPGDTVEFKDGQLYVNGEYVDETNIDFGSVAHTNLGPITLGEDEYFVVGDNRGNSNDSRAVGPISRKMIVAHVQRVLWPLSKFWKDVK